MTQANTPPQKLFSIVLATFNCGRKVENTLQSIFSQNKDLFELIVFDGGSTDETLESINKYAARNDFALCSEKDGGVYDAFNKGIGAAAGKYVYFIGAGDCLRQNVLEEVKDLLPSDDEPASFVYGNFYLMKQKIIKAREYRADDLIFNNICHQAIFYHRDVFKLVGKYDARYKIFADWVFNLRCFDDERINKLYIPCVVADYEEGGISSAMNDDPAFRRDFPHLVKKRLGFAAYVKCRAFMANPQAVAFVYETAYAMLARAVSIATPFIRGFKRVKKSFSQNRLR